MKNTNKKTEIVVGFVVKVELKNVISHSLKYIIFGSHRIWLRKVQNLLDLIRFCLKTSNIEFEIFKSSKVSIIKLINKREIKN